MEDVSNDTFLALMLTSLRRCFWTCGLLRNGTKATLKGRHMRITGGTSKPFKRPWTAFHATDLCWFTARRRKERTDRERAHQGRPPEVYNLENGISGWIAEGHPVVTGPGPRLSSM